MNILKDQDNYLDFHATPWNDKLLGYPSNEITRFVFDKEEMGLALLQEFEKNCLIQQVGFTTCRFDANDKVKKKLLEQNLYYFAESSYVLTKSLNQLDKMAGKLPKLKCSVSTENLQSLTESEVKEIKDIAGNVFHHGRFAEDYKLGKGISDLRNKQWIDAKVLAGNEVYLLRSGNHIGGFMTYKVENEQAVLLLGGVSENYRLYAYNFWYALMQDLRNRNSNSIEVVISAANIPAVNIYSFFEFKFTEFLLGYHKIRE